MTNTRLSFRLAAVALVLGCSSQPAQTQACASNAECSAGQQCTAGACVSTSAGGSASTGGKSNTGTSAGSGGASSSTGGIPGGVSTSGAGGTSPQPQGGTPSAAGSGVGGANTGGTGVNTGGTNPGAAGTSVGVGGASGGRGGTSGTAGRGGMSGTAGTGAAGMAGDGNITGQCPAAIPGLPSYNGNGSVTYYTFAMGSNCANNPPTNKCVNCGFPVTSVSPDKVAHAYTNGGQYFAAMNTADFNNAAACGACVEVTRDGNKKVVATVVDQCPVGSNPRCKKGHIDLSQAAFLQLGTTTEGYLGTGNGGAVGSISWKYVACPVPATQNVTVRSKEPTNAYYTAVIVQDHTFPIKSVKIKGVDAKRDAASNFWLVGDGNQAPGPWDVRVLDVNGWGFEATLAPGQAGDVSTGHRATCN